MKPVTEHTGTVVDAMVTVRPESADGVTLKVPRLNAFEPGFAKVIVCVALLTVRDRVTSAAAR